MLILRAKYWKALKVLKTDEVIWNNCNQTRCTHIFCGIRAFGALGNATSLNSRRIINVLLAIIPSDYVQTTSMTWLYLNENLANDANKYDDEKQLDTWVGISLKELSFVGCIRAPWARQTLNDKSRQNLLRYIFKISYNIQLSFPISQAYWNTNRTWRWIKPYNTELTANTWHCRWLSFYSCMIGGIRWNMYCL